MAEGAGGGSRGGSAGGCTCPGASGSTARPVSPPLQQGEYNVRVTADGKRVPVDPSKPSSAGEPAINANGGVGSEPYGPQQAVHSRYADGTPVYAGQQPARNLPVQIEPNPNPGGNLRTRDRYDAYNERVYQTREYNDEGMRTRDIDYTNPTYPNGTLRPGHPGPPHQHVYDPPGPGRRGPATPY
jgi:hypothetical protein